MTKKNNISIHLSDNAVMHLLMAGLECFNVRIWGKESTTKRGPTETAGTLWGYFIEGSGRQDDHIRVEHISQDTMAERHKGWVALNDDTTWIKSQLVQARWPHLSFIGDWHTHPYETYTECYDANGWKFSKGDYESFEHTWDEQVFEMWHQCKVSLVLTIARLNRVHEEKRWPSEVINNHIVRFQIGDFRFWISAYAIDPTGESSFVVSPGDREVRDDVYIDIPTVNGTDSWFEYNNLPHITKRNWD